MSRQSGRRALYGALLMTEDEQYELLKRRIGWHMTSYDVAFCAVMVALIWLGVAFA
jgi:hypothetical protein